MRHTLWSLVYAYLFRVGGIECVQSRCLPGKHNPCPKGDVTHSVHHTQSPSPLVLHSRGSRAVALTTLCLEKEKGTDCPKRGIRIGVRSGLPPTVAITGDCEQLRFCLRSRKQSSTSKTPHWVDFSLVRIKNVKGLLYLKVSLRNTCSNRSWYPPSEPG